MWNGLALSSCLLQTVLLTVIVIFDLIAMCHTDTKNFFPQRHTALNAITKQHLWWNCLTWPLGFQAHQPLSRSQPMLTRGLHLALNVKVRADLRVVTWQSQPLAWSQAFFSLSLFLGLLGYLWCPLPRSNIFCSALVILWLTGIRCDPRWLETP